MTENICDRICVVPNHETQKKASITDHKASKIRSTTAIIPFEYCDYRQHFYRSQKEK